MFVVGNVEAGVERLVRQPAVGVGEESQAVVEERAPAGVVFTALREATVDVGEAGADAVLAPFQRFEVDGVGEVRGQEPVGLRFQACPVGGQIRNFLILTRVALVERRIDVGSEALVSAVADRDGGVGVRYEAFSNSDGYGAPVA